MGLGAAATFTRLAFVAPYDCRLLSAFFLDDTLLASDDADYWTFALVNDPSDGDPAYTSGRATTVAGGALVANQTETLTLTSTNLSAGDKVYLRVVRAGSGATLAAHGLRVGLTFVAR